MDNNHFLTKLSTATGTDIETIQKLMQGLTHAISERVSKGDKVVVPGLGEFSVVFIPQYLQEDVLTGRMMCMPQSQQLTFTPSPTLKQRLQKTT